MLNQGAGELTIALEESYETLSALFACMKNDRSCVLNPSVALLRGLANAAEKYDIALMDYVIKEGIQKLLETEPLQALMLSAGRHNTELAKESIRGVEHHPGLPAPGCVNCYAFDRDVIHASSNACCDSPIGFRALLNRITILDYQTTASLVTAMWMARAKNGLRNGALKWAHVADVFEFR